MNDSVSLALQGMLLGLFSLVAAAIVHPTALNAPLPEYGAPVEGPDGLIVHHFATSWGEPHPKVNLTVPDNFEQVQLSIDFATDGRQYDRLGHILVDGVQVWRFSTPEPSFRTIASTLRKDVSEYLALFKNGATLELSLDNSLLGAGLGGILNVTVSVSYFSAPNSPQRAYQQWWYDEAPTRYIALQGGQELADVPPKETLKLPQVSKQTTRAGIQVAASGNSGEEFWYTNLNNQTGSTRQIRIKIDGVLAAFVDPFQAAYTGAWYPEWWNNLAGAQDYDIPSYFIDISSFLPDLWNKDMTIEVDVGNGFNNDTINAQWLVNTALVVWEDENEEAIGGTQLINENLGQPLVESWVENSEGDGLDYTGFYNSINLSATLHFQSKSVEVKWLQEGNSRSAQNYTLQGQTGLTWQKGSFEAQYGSTTFSQAYEYPRTYYTSNLDDSAFFYYGYILQNSGFTSYTLNNTVFARNTRSSPNSSYTSETDGYLGYIDSSGHAASEHLAATPTNITSDAKWDGYTLGQSQWEQVLGQADAAVQQGPSSVASILLGFASDLTGFKLLSSPPGA